MMESVGGLAIVLMIAAFMAAFAPVIMAVAGNKGMPLIVTLVLTLAAGVVVVTQQNVFGQIFGGIMWLGAVVIGSASYMAAHFAKAIKKNKADAPQSSKPHAPRRAAGPAFRNLPPNSG